MKKTFLGFGLVLSLSLVAGAVAVATRDTPHAAQAASYTAYTTSTLPKIIDLNDTSEADIRSYYSGLNSLSATERQGTNLLKNLKPILKNGQKYFSYDSSSTKKAIWQAYEIVDRDWEKSPASSISGYNSATNKISNYSYGTSTSSKGTNPYLHALYVNRNVDNQTTAWDDHNAGQWSINQEHIWAKAEGFDAEGAGGARGDLMHLWAGNGKINQSVHSNYYYAYVDTTKSYTNGSTYFSNVSGNLMGYSKTLGGSTTVFEPQDADKGDIARACFYMVARYNYYSGSDSDGIDSNNPNLILTNLLTDWSQNGYTSSTSSTGKMGVLQDLLEWNRLDPPDEWEKHRNNLLYNNYTFNRNPFIDFPEWAEYIWGKSESGTYSSASTGVATPSTDAVGVFEPAGPGVSISETSASVYVGNAVTLTATASDSSTITWSSSNSSIASVNSGVVTGVSAGKATITASATIGGNAYSASCEVTVVNEPSVSISETSASVDIGGTITLSATASDSSAITWSSSKSSIARVNGGVVTGVAKGNATITASATIGGKGYSASCEVTVKDPSLTISMSSASVQVGKSITLTATASNSGVVTWSSSAPSIASVDGGVVAGVSEGSATITASLTAGGKDYSANCEVTVLPPTPDPEPGSAVLKSISLDTENVKKDFLVNESFTYSGLVVTAHYDDDTSKIVIPTGVIAPDMSKVGTKTVTVTFTEGGVTKTATYDITINNIVATCDKSFYVGESIKKSDITVKYLNGLTITEFTLVEGDENGRYTFLYGDAASGGAATDKTFTIIFWGASCTLTVKVSRKAPTDEATAENLANLIMFKEADEMTETDWAEAIRIFNAMSKEERMAFIKGNTDSVVMTSARARFVTVLDAKGNTIYQSGDDYQIKGHERDAGKGAIPNIVIIIAIGAGALLVLIVVIIILVHSKKARKVAKKAVKKAIKSSSKKKK